MATVSTHPPETFDDLFGQSEEMGQRPRSALPRRLPLDDQVTKKTPQYAEAWPGTCGSFVNKLVEVIAINNLNTSATIMPNQKQQGYKKIFFMDFPSCV